MVHQSLQSAVSVLVVTCFCQLATKGCRGVSSLEMAACSQSLPPLLLGALIFNGTLLSYVVYSYVPTTYWMNPTTHSLLAGGNIGPKMILAWDSFYKLPDFGCEGLGSQPFRRCPQPNCYLTTNRSLATNASAILFHIMQTKNVPKVRTPNQVYVFFMREAASRDYNFKKDRNLRKVKFNLTMTYRRDSDIPHLIGKVYKLPSMEVKHEKYRLKFPFSVRNRSVAWVVSNCETDSKRELYVKRLKQFIDIDIYGKCGNYSNHTDYHTFFYEVLPSQYKFYLAFENSICKDYVTEKLFRTLQTELVPIVLGGTNYSRDAPRHSYIDIMDYRSPRDLAAFLRRLSRNETEYLKYFQWKNSHFTLMDQLWRGCCELCRRLNTASYHKTYNDVMDWWSRDMCDNEMLSRKRAKRWQHV